ncbi:MAG: hypothetical protein JWQ35_136 [Bacteriovoracaceae bacterium]|nr:hypothetical protein [Bacteriovoracaceae bacterium]
MFGIGKLEVLIFILVIILLFGSARIPQLGSGIGQAIKNFKKAMKEPDAIDVTPKEKDASKDNNSKKET